MATGLNLVNSYHPTDPTWFQSVSNFAWEEEKEPHADANQNEE